MPVMESKPVSSEPVTNGEVATQPEEPQTTQEGTQELLFLRIKLTLSPTFSTACTLACTLDDTSPLILH